MNRLMHSKKKIAVLVMLAVVAMIIIGQETYASETKEKTATIEQVNIITQHKVQLLGKEMELKDKSIKLVGPRGAGYTAKYDEKEQVFVLPEDEIAVGTPYTLQLNFATVPKQYETLYIPNVVEAKLTSPNTLEVIFDTEVDVISATKPENYWIRTSQNRASGISSLGKNDKVDDTNALSAKQVSIEPKDASNKIMVMTFMVDAEKGVSYSLIPCFINATHSQSYRGGNFNQSSKLDFKVE